MKLRVANRFVILLFFMINMQMKSYYVMYGMMIGVVSLMGLQYSKPVPQKPREQEDEVIISTIKESSETVEFLDTTTKPALSDRLEYRLKAKIVQERLVSFK
jgi:hypothetical protein